MTASLRTGELSQQAFVRGDGGLRRLPPAELPRPLEARLPRPRRVGCEARGGTAERIRVAVVDELAGTVDDLGQARVPVSRDRATASERLETREAETLVPAREHETTGRRVDVDKVRFAEVPQHARIRHLLRRLLPGLADEHELELRPRLPG